MADGDEQSGQGMAVAPPTPAQASDASEGRGPATPMAGNSDVSSDGPDAVAQDAKRELDEAVAALNTGTAGPAELKRVEMAIGRAATSGVSSADINAAGQAAGMTQSSVDAIIRAAQASEANIDAQDRQREGRQGALDRAREDLADVALNGSEGYSMGGPPSKPFRGPADIPPESRTDLDAAVQMLNGKPAAKAGRDSASQSDLNNVTLSTASNGAPRPNQVGGPGG